MMKKLFEAISVTAELMGQTISPTASAVMGGDLEQYPIEVVLEALGNLRREAKGRFSLAAVIEQIEKLTPDGRPGADEAWAMIPRDEYTSAVLSDEMLCALGIAQPLLDEGDQVAARMAFKEAYIRMVGENKRNGVAVRWIPSLGFDKEGREAALNTAVRLGRVGADHAGGLLAPSQAVAMLESNGKKLAIEHKQELKMPPEQHERNKHRIAEMVRNLAKGKSA